MGKRKRDKKPVLTSPWKIGTMVALMLIATSFGVGYYMVRVYDIDLYWLSSDISRWIVDSYQFFKEIYPAAAGVVLLALFTYFVIASAVRRYKYYLNSGQDYRKMISLADSIDDLTNPAQIARLSEYPELQEVLRNYGDQIREISEGMETREEELRSVDLEMEIDSVLEGKGMNETLAEGKWWASIAKKVMVWVDENSCGRQELTKQSEAVRQAAGRASLSCGKVVETAAGASEDILDIIRAVGELNALANSPEPDGSGMSAGTGIPSDAIEVIGTAAAALEERGSAIHDLSEESNGLALNIALMAARGEATETDLAQLAEKVRSTAERFGKLGRELESLARTVAEGSRNARTSAGGSAAAGTRGQPGSGRGIIGISAKIESCSRALQQKMTTIGYDVEEINKALQSGHVEAGDIKVTDDGDDRIRVTDGSIVNFGADSKGSADEQGGIDDSGLVIEHSKLWEGPDTAPGNGMEFEDDTGASSDDAAEKKVSNDSDEFLISGFQKAMSAMLPGNDQQQDEDDVAADEPAAGQVEEEPSPGEEEKLEEMVEEAGEQEQVEETPDVMSELFVGDPAVEAEQAAANQEETIEEADPVEGESWDDMQGQNDDQQKMEAEPAVESAPAGESPVAGPDVVQEPDTPVSDGSMEEGISDGGEEHVYDLFDLGAVEYLEETEVNL